MSEDQIIETDRMIKPTSVDLDEAFRRNKTVLIVDDDPDTIDLLKKILRLADFDVASAQSGVEALSMIGKIEPDVILLDLMMPEVDGRTTLSMLRRQHQTPVIVVSALNNPKDITELLYMGSDDYVTKPFNREELVARIHAVLRRSKMENIIHGISIPETGLRINFTRREVLYQNRMMRLSPKEYDLLELLAKNIPHFVRNEEISYYLWGKDSVKSRNGIKTLIHGLRKKFDAIHYIEDLIITADRIGYRLRTD